jgi:hypothetical protein
MASIYRALGLPLPEQMPYADDRVLGKFAELLARIMPFDLVIGERTASGEEARVSRTSVCGNWGAVAGSLRYFADRFGIPRASIEGTQISFDRIKRYATYGPAELVYEPRRKNHPLAVQRTLAYFGFELGREREAIDEFPPELVDDARRTLAAALSRGEARHPAVKRNHAAIEEVRELHRRSGGRTLRLGFNDLAVLYERRLAEQDVRSMSDFRAADLTLGPLTDIAEDERARLMALPAITTIRGRDVPMDYDVEDGTGVVRLRLPEKMARTLVDSELPELDRPLRFVVTRGQRGAVRAPTLSELQELLDRPWTRDEVERAEAAPRRGKGRGGPRGRRRRR